ncbi:MAG: hypothetical protein IJ304_01180 [Clostridia bacterium]|nr:hypothetical protein [Clostridia bacterium]
MEKYERAEMDVVEFETEDIITTSGTSSCNLEGYAPDICGEDGHSCFDFGCRVN